MDRVNVGVGGKERNLLLSPSHLTSPLSSLL